MQDEPFSQPPPSSPVPPNYPAGIAPMRRVEGVRPPRPSWALWMLLFLVVLLILPSMARRIEYAIWRGREDAQADAAQERLDQSHTVSIADYRDVVKAIQPSVVGVKATHLVGREPTDELSYMFFGRRQRMQEQDQGSGVIVDAAGYIITNFHVVARASDVSVELSDGSQHSARVIGTDSATDLAVLKIDTPDLRPAQWGNSEQLEVGDPVLAIGNPFGLARTVTAGILSAKGRHAVIENVSYQDFLQTDAAVNPGNSGGPLVNMKAQVIGINTAIVGPAYQGISFAIPSNLVEKVYDTLKRGEKVVRGWLGVSMQELTPDLVEKLGLKSTSGALVAGVVRGSPGAQAGLEAGDVIIRWNDKPINDPNELAMAVAWSEIGTNAKVVIIRNGQEQTLTVKVAQRPESIRPENMRPKAE